MTQTMPSSAVVLLAVLTLLGSISQGNADEPTQQLVYENFDAIYRVFEKLNGRTDRNEEYIRMLFHIIASEQSLMVKHGSVLQTVYSSGAENQKEKYLEEMRGLLCMVRDLDKKLCKLGARIDKIEEANHREYRRLWQEIDRLKYRQPEPQPGQSRSIVVPTPADPNSATGRRTTFYRGDSPPKPVSLRVDAIVRSASHLCPNATRIATCIDYVNSRGTSYHGNLYLDCSNRHILVLHTKTKSNAPLY